VYERLINFTTDAGTKDALQFLMTREITHMKAFAAALESLHKPPFVIGRIPPTPGLVDQFFNDSTGVGEEGEIDARGPWNDGGDWTRVEAPAFRAMRDGRTGSRRGTDADGEAGTGIDERELVEMADDAPAAVDDRSTSTAADAALMEELLVEQLQDLLHAEGQLVKALPKMAKAAHSEALVAAFEQHLVETRAQVARLQEVFGMVGVQAKPKPCKGMAGLLEEGEEVIEEGADKDPAAADLGLIAAAQRVEHYEIAGYTTARNLAGQAGLPAVGDLLNQSLAEEEISDTLLAQIARELMSEARAGLTKAPKRPSRRPR
jgi:Mn-containing catalase